MSKILGVSPEEKSITEYSVPKVEVRETMIIGQYLPCKETTDSGIILPVSAEYERDLGYKVVVCKVGALCEFARPGDVVFIDNIQSCKGLLIDKVEYILLHEASVMCKYEDIKMKAKEAKVS